MTASILIIEDNHVNLELMTYLLGAHGYELQSAVDGNRGIELVLENDFDLVICDIQMPGIDGYEVARRLKGGERPEFTGPLIAITALAMVGDREKVLAAGFDGYFAKPIDPEEFVAGIEAFLPGSLRARAVHGGVGQDNQHKISPQDKVLLVVDNLQMNRDLADSLLGGFGYKVITASGLTEALTRLRHIKPDLILSDVVMEEGSGFDFIRMVKADPALQSIPFIFITSTAMTEKDRRKGLELGAVQFLFRPLDAEILLQEIATAIGADARDD